MRKTGSKGYFVLSVVFFQLSLMWFFWIKNTVTGIIWGCAAVCDLVIALAIMRKEKTER